jgi:hypothetical protein
MRSTHFARYFVAFIAVGATCSSAACTGLLGSYEVGGAPAGGGAAEGGPNSEGGPILEGGAGDTSTPMDGPIDSPPSCSSPTTLSCPGVCVDPETDKDNCGSCGRSCLGGRCVAHVCQPFLASARTDVAPTTLIATDTDLFFATTANDVVQQPLAALAAPIKLTATGGQIFGIAVSGTRAYFTAENPAGSSWDLWSGVVSTPGSGTASGFTYGGTPVGLAVAGGNVFTALALGGTPPGFFISGCSQATLGCMGYFNGPGSPGNRIVAGNGNIFWTDLVGGFVYATTDDTMGARVQISATEATPTVPAWDGTTLYWINGGNGVIRRSPYPAVNVTSFQSIGGNAPDDLLVDAANVYYSQYDGSAMASHLYVIAKTAPLGTAPTTIATGDIRRLAQNATGVFWVEAATGVHAYRKP